MRYFIEFSYNGSTFFGYQIQPNEISVQEELEKALSTILRTEIKTTGAGRTDTGVHAKKMFAHFDFDGEISEKLVHQLNSFLPPSIAVKKIFTRDFQQNTERMNIIFRWRKILFLKNLRGNIGENLWMWKK
jgi:tRNA pseudouridine38-40 synthase